MRVVIAGGHGKIALWLTGLLAKRGDAVVGIVRNPDHTTDVRDAGGDVAVLDLEQASTDEIAAVLSGADAAVFAAGAGPGSGTDRKDTVDRAASALLADAAELASVPRYLQISAMGLDRADDPAVEPVFAAYLRAKLAAEQDLTGRALLWTVLRPGRLTDDPATGLVHLTQHVGYGSVSRQDVATVLVGLLDSPRTAGRVLELVGGTIPVEQALADLA